MSEAELRRAYEHELDLEVAARVDRLGRPAERIVAARNLAGRIVGSGADMCCSTASVSLALPVT